MIRVAIVTTGFLLLVVGCGNSRSTTPSASTKGQRGAIAVDTDRFPHGVHTGDKPEIRNWQGRGLACADCHDAKLVVEGKPSRPGTNQHSPCDDCHKAEFGKAPGKLCRVCHEQVDPFAKGNSPLRPYPLRDTTEALAATFSHALHLDRGRMERATGGSVGCEDCHERDPQTRDPRVPGHKACARCHEKIEGVKARLAMERCDGCHPTSGVALAKCNVLNRDLIFHHNTHEKDRAGRRVACTACHLDADQSRNRSDMRVPPMSRCAVCHEDARKTPDRVRMENCGGCHLDFDIGTPPMSRDLRPLCD
jgi:hypothetical protein